jgi:hypothetical protein
MAAGGVVLVFYSRLKAARTWYGSAATDACLAMEHSRLADLLDGNAQVNPN